MGYNNSTGPLTFTANNAPNLWRTPSYVERLQKRRNKSRKNQNKPGVLTQVKNWFTKPSAVSVSNPAFGKTRRRHRTNSRTRR